MEYWRFIKESRRDAAIIKGIQERVIALVASIIPNPQQPEASTSASNPLQADDNALSALDEEIAAMHQVTNNVLRLARNTAGMNTTGMNSQLGPTSGEGSLVVNESRSPGVDEGP